MAGKSYKDMSPEEKAAAFEKWQEGREVRKVGSKAKKMAQSQLKAKYADEFASILAGLEGKPAPASKKGR